MGADSAAYRRFDRPEVVRIAGEHHWVLSLDELRGLGMRDGQVLRDARNGRLHRVFEGVYAVGRPELSFEGRCRAALLACGPGAAISHYSAGRLWGIRSWSGRIHVTIPRNRKGHPGLVAHRPRSFSIRDVVERDGLAVTSVGRTLLDLAATSPFDRVERDLHEADVQRVVDLREVWSVIARSPAHRGRGKLAAALSREVAPTRTGLERAFLAICREAGLPEPEVNRHVWTGNRLEEVDFLWPELRLIVETDGGRYHGTRYRRRRDAEKTRRLEDAGWRVRRFDEVEIELAPAAVAAEVRQMCRVGCSDRRISAVRSPMASGAG